MPPFTPPTMHRAHERECLVMPPYSLWTSMVTFMKTAMHPNSYMVTTVARTTESLRIPASRGDMLEMEDNSHLSMMGEIILTARTFIHSLSWGFMSTAVFSSRQV